MTELNDRIAGLSPEKRALLEKRLAQKKAEEAKKQALKPRQDPGQYPLSFAQQRMWFLNQWEPGSPFYNISSAVRMRGRLDVAALERSFSEIVRRHEVLRASFATQHGLPVQHIAPAQPFRLAATDLSDVPPGDELEARIQAEILQEARFPFDLGDPHLLRVRLLRAGPEEHVLAVTFHHMVADGWSIGVFIQETLALYHAFAGGRPSPLPELPIQYADYAQWQREWLQGERLEAQLSYWKQRLQGGQFVLDLPADAARPAVQSFAGARASLDLPPGLSAQLKAFSKQHDSTMFMTLLAAFQAMLSRYTGQEDLCVGTPVANRTRHEVEGLIGFFVNTLVMRADLSDPAEGRPLTFLEHLQRVRAAVLEDYAHQDLPLEMLMDSLDVARDMSRTPLFQVMFAYQDSPLQRMQLPGLELELIDVDNGTAKFDMILYVDDLPGGLRLALEYNTDLYQAATARRMLRHFETLLGAILANPCSPLASLSFLPEEERARLAAWNATATDFPILPGLAQLFEQQVQASPDAVAVTALGVGGSSEQSDALSEASRDALTYAALNRRANRLAHYLRRLAIGPDRLVGIYLERSLESVIATLGIIKAGGAYLPLDLSYPPERLAFMLEDARTPVLLTDSALADHLPKEQIDRLGVQLICLDQVSAEVEQESDDNPTPAAGGENLAYVMYTSGSTGQPKGVAVPQRAISRLVINTDYVRIEPGDRIPHVANTSFDAATFEIWGALLCGARLVVIPKDTVLALRSFGEVLRREKISVMFMTTALFNHMAAETPGAFAGLNTLMFGGEAVDPKWVRAVLRDGPPERLLNVYGPTETTTFASWFRIEAVAERATNIPIGGPLANTTLHVLDAHGRPAPIGVPGELYIGGPGVARGYLNRPELTAERFVPDPWGGQNDRLYRTGDRVRRLADGNIEFLGRFDFQVKLRGLRIELGEIETRLGEHPAVGQALVLVREDVPGDKRLVAYLAPRPGQTLKADEVRTFLKARLPDYMIPAALVILEQLPINANGKIDRRALAALPAPDLARAEDEKAYVAPSTPLEQFIARRWQELLGVRQVGLYDNFFELGGDSLKAAVLMNRFQEELGQPLHVRSIFMAPTVAELSLYVSEYFPELVKKLGGQVSQADVQARVGEELKARAIQGAGAGESRPVTPERLAEFRRLVRPLPARPASLLRPHKNAPAVFVLSPPRSGSTLLRTMLAGSPRLFSPPELDLLSFNTIAERRAAFSGKHAFWLEGVLRAIMEIRACSADEAQALMDEMEARGASIQELYALMQNWLGGRLEAGGRLLVDKTPVYALDPEILKRAEEDFENPLYIHLMRHPYASIYSFIEAKLDGVFFRYEHNYTQRELAEMVWTVSHQNILTFLDVIPAERQMRIVFEDLVSDPLRVMQDTCGFLGIEFHPGMLKPYEGDKMTSGVRPGAQMVGDFKFYLRKSIDRNAADRWKKFQTEDFLSAEGWALGESLGYRRASDAPEAARPPEAALPPLEKAERADEIPLSFAQQRLWFLDQWEPGSAYYNIPSGVRMKGRLNVAALTRAVTEIVRRHEALRTTFDQVDGRPVQRIAGDVQLDIEEIDLSGLPVLEREAEAQRRGGEHARQPFDLARGPLLRTLLLRMDRDDAVVLVNMHHIIADGWSSAVFIRELAALYPAFAEGQASPLPDLPIQYADYAIWQRRWMDGPALEGQLTYWKQQLAGLSPALELPFDHPRPAVQTLRGRRLLMDLPPALASQVRTLCRQQGATLYMVMLAAFNALLYRYTGQEDLCVGTPVANRGRAEIEGLIGFFVNTLVLRTQIAGELTFLELLERVRRAAVEAYDHQDVPFERLVDLLQPERSTAHTPLFQVMFTVQEAQIPRLELPGLELQPVQADSGTVKFDLILTVIERGSVLKVLFEYNADLFEPETIERMAAHFTTLLSGLAEAPGQAIGRLPLLTQAETDLLLVDWNRTEAPAPCQATLAQLFAEQARRTPQHPAVRAGGQELSYAQLDERSNRLARLLQRLGVGPDTLVGLMLERSVDLLVGMLAIFKAGGAYLPLDPDYPSDRLAYILEDAQVGVLLTHKALLESVPPGADNRRVICLDDDAPEIDRESSAPVISPAGPHALAYVIYTSGSTGKPKGVMIEQGGVINLWAALRQSVYSRLGPGPFRVSQNASVLFDASVQGWLMLLSGDTVCIPPQEVRLDGEALLAWVQRERLDVLDCVPAQLKLLLRAGLLDAPGWKPLAVLPGGEAIDQATWEQLAQSEIEFFNMYGPTETTVDSTICRVKDHPHSASIGRPAANVRHYVLDPSGQPAPLGVPGELVIGGAGVGRGYLNRPDLTAERFVEDPFARPSNGGAPARMYRSGDLVRWLPDGFIEYLGRVDQQVKVRGFRIELGEIEAVLLRHAGVQQAAVALREDVPGEKQLVAYLAANLAPDLQSLDTLWNESPQNDRRSSFRVSASLPCLVELADGRSQSCTSLNVSMSGICVENLPVPMQVGETARLQVGMPDQASWLIFPARLVWQTGQAASFSLAMLEEQRQQLKYSLAALRHAREFTVIDRRQAEFRLAIRQPGRIGALDVWTKDLSPTGACIEVGEASFTAGQELPLALNLPGQDGLTDLPCRVIWAQGGRIGVRFEAPGDAINGLRSALAEVIGRKNLTVTGLRAFLKSQLPEYMIPAVYVILDRLPLTPNGKIDRRALPKPEGLRLEVESTFEAARTQREETLVRIWAEVLGLPQVGINDNFFELGGDSILSIQVVTRARAAGMKLTPRHLFEAQTVAELAQKVDSDAAVIAEQGPVTGEAPLTPIQRWFFEQDLPNPHHWNQALLFKVNGELEPARLEQALRTLVEHHDALRMRFEPGEQGWRQWNAGLEGAQLETLTCHDLTQEHAEAQAARLAHEIQTLQESLHISRGPLLRVGYFKMAPGEGRLLLVSHHLVIDGVSWRILLEDLQTAYGQLIQGQPVALPAKTTSFVEWGRRLEGLFAESPAPDGGVSQPESPVAPASLGLPGKSADAIGESKMEGEIEHWQRTLAAGAARLPRDFAGGENREADASTLRISFTPEETRALLVDLPQRFGTEINDILLAALALAHRDWTGSSEMVVDLEGHGREEIAGGLDLTRTVGWFTSLYPVRLALRSGDSLGSALLAVKEQLRAVPGRGIGYGLLRYLHPDADVRLRLARPAAEISFNYLGQVQRSEEGLFSPAPEEPGETHDPAGQRCYLLDIYGSAAGGRLLLEWRYSQKIHRRARVEAWAAGYAAHLRALIGHAAQATGYSPSDFPEANLSEDELAGLLDELGDLDA